MSKSFGYRVHFFAGSFWLLESIFWRDLTLAEYCLIPNYSI
ncbi:unnamed protein product [Acidithrix sp. C25]|nr:unnamed protein product [Acidithrix sp. C25]